MFTFEPQFLVDFEMANHYVSTFPTSQFVQTLTVQLSTPEARYLLRDHEYTVARGELTDSRMIKDADLLKVLSEIFGLEFPIGTQFQSQAQRLETLLGAA